MAGGEHGSLRLCRVYAWRYCAGTSSPLGTPHSGVRLNRNEYRNHPL